MAREITKLAIKAMFITLLSIVGAAFAVVLFLSFSAPAAMARLTLDIGMYEQSAWYSSRQYDEGEGDIEHIELAFNCSVLAGDTEGVVEYGTAFIEDARFMEYAKQKETQESGKYKESYIQYVYGQVSVAYYRTENKTKAEALALSVNTQTFDEYNAVTDLINEVILSGDKIFAEDILSSLTDLQATGNVKNTQYLTKAVNNLKLFTA
ncbi:MAG: hypothetical protein IJY26_04430 [Clostridia bacterium]|nr:hypothetical protein [Clostridia bacterium]